jgi:two-component system, OmpR family, sensor histidine kinase KdpD
MARSRLPLRQLTLRYLAMTAAVLLVVLVYRRILHVNQTTVALTFLVVIQLVAFAWGLVYSIYLSIACTLLYNFFFLPPIGTFTVASPENWVALMAFLASAIFISNISERERRQAAVSEARRREMELLYEFSQQLLMDERLHDLARHAPRVVASTFGLSPVALYLTENDTAYFSDPGRTFVSIEQLRGVTQLPDASRDAPKTVRIVPLMLGMRANGSIAMTEGEYSDGLYDAIGGLLAIALERAAALERFSRVEAAREGERLRSALLDSVTHELRTPLTAIRAAATSLLSQPWLGEDQRHEMFVIVEEESTRLDRLIGQAVEMAQLDANGVHLRLRTQKLREVVEMALEDSRLLLRGRPVSVELPDDLPAVSMDRELIRRVFRHLLENAARYSPAGSPIRISSAIAKNRLLVSISDEGQGIDESEQTLIFDKFYRGNRQRHSSQGTGMGLAIVKAILRAHQGGIDVISHPQQGASFSFWIPLDAQSIP